MTDPKPLNKKKKQRQLSTPKLLILRKISDIEALLGKTVILLYSKLVFLIEGTVIILA